MTKSPMIALLQLLRAAAQRDGNRLTDGELLTRFLGRHDEAALAALVERHAPMVWGVCCRLLRHPPDAEDAFQATFLVLVQKASSVAPVDRVANWLHGVARQTAMRLRATAAKRGWREVQMNELPEPAVAESRDEELLSLLDEELSRLPQRSRALIVLCDLEGRTRKDVARQLGCPEGTVASGLVRARDLLAKRLSRRGLAVSGGSLVVALSHSVASAEVPMTVVISTINVATLLAAGKAAGVISGPTAILLQGVMKTMFLKKIMTPALAALALGAAVLGGSLALGQASDEGKPAVGKVANPLFVEKPVEPAAQKPAQKEAEVAWGKETGGLQLGLVLMPADKTVYRHGETMELAVKARNVGKGKITISYGHPEFSPPKVTDAQGTAARVSMPPLLLGTVVAPTEKTLQPGETVELGRKTVSVDEEPKGEAVRNGSVSKPTVRIKAGKYNIAITESVGSYRFLTTGTVDFEVKDRDEKELPLGGLSQKAELRAPSAPVLLAAAVPEGKGGARPGASFRIMVPALGPVPIAIDFGFPIVVGEGDRDRRFNFSIGFTR